jgi:two-component system, response regulator YesN
MRIAVLKPIWGQENNIPGWIDSNCLTLCEQYCQHICSCYAVLDTNDNIALILKDYSNSMTEEQYQKLLLSCAEKLSEQLTISFLTVLGNNVSSVSELSDSYRLCKQTMEREQILGNVFEDEIYSKLENDTVSVIDYSELSRCFIAQDTASLQQFIHTCFTCTLSDSSLSNLDTVKYQLIEFVICAMQTLGSSQLPEQDITHQKHLAFEIISNTNSLPVLEEKLQSFFSSLMVQLKGMPSNHYTFLVQNALSYVRSNYNDCNLSLKTLASQMDVNAAYLGRQFGLETGEYFSDYLNRIRVAQAIKLLDETTLKTAKIAEAVGFYNISYFFTIFKKITGSRPGDHRKN